MKKIGLFILLVIFGMFLVGCEFDDEIDDGQQEYPEYQYVKSKILTINQKDKKLELLNYGVFNYTNELKIFHHEDEKLKEVSVSDLYIGQENIYLQIDENNDIVSILIDNSIGFKNIRVAIRKDISDITDESMLYHDEVLFLLNANSKIYSIDNKHSYDLKRNQNIKIETQGSKLKVQVDGRVLFETDVRVIIEPSLNTYTTTFTSIKRAQGTPSYKGNLEIALIKDRLLVINDLPLELYLENVLPSEMPASFSPEALKAQAVAARTYAYKDILNKTTEEYGYSLDDSTKSQVYNNQASNSNTDAAIRNTKGLVMTNNNVPINAYYYSASSGLTASAHEVWITSPTLPPVIDYLQGQNLTTLIDGTIVEYDYQNEDSMLEFFKLINCITPDPTSYHRWRINLTSSQITNILNNTLRERYQSTPELILTLENDNFISREIPNDIGEVLDLNVSRRGSSGVVISLDITTTEATYRIINQYNIRFSLRPNANYANTPVLIEYANQGRTGYKVPQNGPTVLPSGFFALEKNGSNFTIYGGGNGHGVGMSQYGAHGLGQQGKTFREILNTYYSLVDLVDITYNYQTNKNIEEVFKLINQ